ncbi:hypothetical protein FHX48_002661 [Microbacterium halimionae]|uniref:Uncharacterized protein n=1 Tax=Microbacterium halimionae TaxID=1526413 RepID=A0A7W3PMY3_9MICO|nr:hypothetical protein [Microbacterium halimionae]MBA8817556.1 hypothetical protein [Microbacterium halimionae]NII94266.1 hypothetical protein [Microbacterium halimionae]
MNDNERMPRAHAIEDLLVERMHSDLTRPRWWRTWWGKLSAAGTVFVLAGVSIAAFQVLQPAPVTDTEVVDCLADPPLNADGSLSGTSVSVLTEDGRINVDDAVATCRTVWEAGFPADDPLDPSPTPGDIPTSFTVCVTNDGHPAVAPGDIDCVALSLHPADG